MSQRKLVLLLVGIAALALLLSACSTDPEAVGQGIAKSIGPAIKESAEAVFKGLQEFVRGLLSGG